MRGATNPMSNLIIEGAIFQEPKVVDQSPTRAVARLVLQTAGEKNQNKRVYPLDVLKSALENCNQRMQRRSFYGELDHPFPLGNEDYDGIRQTTVALQQVSHIIRSYDFDGNKVIGELETLTTPNGKTLLALLRDKTGLGISMRGMAELDRRPDANYVKSPLTIVSYDSVSLPSHASAVVDFNEMRFEASMLKESPDTICVDGICFLPNYFDKLVEKKIIGFFKRWV